MSTVEVAVSVIDTLFKLAFVLVVAAIVAAIAYEFIRVRRPRRVAPTERHLHLVGAEVVDLNAHRAERRQIGGAA